MMIEADVSLGTLVGHPDQAPLPIMAHPPADTSDLSLQMFLDMVVQVPASSSGLLTCQCSVTKFGNISPLC